MLLLLTAFCLVQVASLTEPSSTTSPQPTNTTIPPSLSVTLPSCPDLWRRADGVCYRVVGASILSANWYQARAWCASQAPGGDLATINTPQLNQLVLTLGVQEAYGQLWLGFSDAYSEGRWWWPDGTVPTFVNWGPDQPDNASGNQHCVTISLSHFRWAAPGEWDDDFCSQEKGGFVCQAAPTSD